MQKKMMVLNVISVHMVLGTYCYYGVLSGVRGAGRSIARGVLRILFGLLLPAGKVQLQAAKLVVVSSSLSSSLAFVSATIGGKHCPRPRRCYH